MGLSAAGSSTRCNSFSCRVLVVCNILIRQLALSGAELPLLLENEHVRGLARS